MQIHPAHGFTIEEQPVTVQATGKQLTFQRLEGGLPNAHDIFKDLAATRTCYKNIVYRFYEI